MTNNDVREILCRVFDDDANDLVAEWHAWYRPEKWLGMHRALGAFIRQRLNRVALTGQEDGWTEPEHYAYRPSQLAAPQRMESML